MTFEEESVLVRFELKIVAQPNGWHEHPHFLGERFADARDAVEQVAAFVFIGEPHQPVAELDLQGVEAEQCLEFVGRGHCRTGFRRFSAGGCPGGCALGAEALAQRVQDSLFIPQRTGKEACEQGEHHKWQHRQAGHKGENEEHDRENGHGPREEEQLLAQFRAELLLGGSPRHQDARGRRRDQSRDLRDEPVADGEEGKALQRLRNAHALLHDADGEAANHVDESDEHGGDGVAAHEFAGAVHGPVEIGLLFDAAPAFAGLRFVNDAGVEFGVDGHLFAGEGVQGEAGRHFGDAPGALGDHDEIDHDEDEEDHQADHVIAAHDEIAEGFNDMPGVTVEENEARGGDIEREPEERNKQEQRGKRVKIGRFADVKDDEQDQEREGDADGEEPVEEKRAHGQDHQKDGPKKAAGEEQVAVAEQPGDERDWTRGGHISSNAPQECGVWATSVVAHDGLGKFCSR